MANVKIGKVDFRKLQDEMAKITAVLKAFILNNENFRFENELLEALAAFNRKHFPSPEYKIQLREKNIIEQVYASAKESEFAQIFHKLQQKYQLKIRQDTANTFLEKWYLKPVRKEIDFVFDQLKKSRIWRRGKLPPSF